MRVGDMCLNIHKVYFHFILLFIFFFSRSGAPPFMNEESPSLSRKTSLMLFQGGKEAARQSCGVEVHLLLLSRFSHVGLLATPRTAAYQAPPSMGFSRQEYWSGVPLPSPEVHLSNSK